MSFFPIMFEMNFFRLVKKNKLRSNENKTNPTYKTEQTFSSSLDSLSFESDFKKQHHPVNPKHYQSTDISDIKGEKNSFISPIEPAGVSFENNTNEVISEILMTEKPNENPKSHPEINHEWYLKNDTAWFFSNTNTNDTDTKNKIISNEKVDRDPTTKSKTNLREGTPIIICTSDEPITSSHHLNPNEFWTWRKSNSSSDVESCAIFDDLFISQKDHYALVRYNVF